MYRQRTKLDRAMEYADREMKLLAPLEQQIGCRISRGWNWVRDESRGSSSNNVSIYRCEVTAHGVLPRWAGFVVSQHSDPASEALLYLFAGDRPRARLPHRASLVASGGDLTLEGPEQVGQPSNVVTAYTNTIVEVAKEIGSRRSELAQRAVETAIASSNEHRRAAAVRMLVRRFDGTPELAEAITAAKRSGVPMLEVLAASATGDVSTLRRYGTSPVELQAVRLEAVEGLVRAHDLDGLLSVAKDPPAGSERRLIEALSVSEDRRVPETLHLFLKHRSNGIVEAAADALARRGDQSSLAPLVARLDAGNLSDGAHTALTVAIDVIRGRAGVGGQQGALAMVEEESSGALSDPEKGSGGVSFPED